MKDPAHFLHGEIKNYADSQRNEDHLALDKMETVHSDAAGYGRAGREIQENADDNQNRYQREQYFVNGPPPVGDLRTAVS